MQILHIVESFAGGVYDFIADLTNGMTDFQHIVVYSKREYTPNDFYQHFPKDVTFIHWKSASREISPKNDLKALIELLIILKTHRDTDVIHLHSSKAGFLGRVAARILGSQNKVIYTPHGVSFLRKDVSLLKHKLFITLEKIGYFCGGDVVACSKSEAEEFHFYNIPAKYINNGTICQKTRKSHNTEGKITIATIGRITYPKNPVMFNELANKFIENETVEFLWIGDGELREKLKSPNIKITGWLNRNDVNEYLDKVDIYLSTSLWEGLPLSVLQAMCANKPLLMSDCVGNRDLVQDGFNGKLFKTIEEAEQALVDMLENQNILQLFGENSKKLLQSEFTMDKTISEYRKFYIDITKKNK